MAKGKGRKNTKKNEAGPSREDMPSRKHQDKMIIDGDPPPMSSSLMEEDPPPERPRSQPQELHASDDSVAVGEISSLSSLTQLPSSSGQQEQAVPNGSARSGRSASSTTSSRVPATKPSILKKLPKPTVEDESDNEQYVLKYLPSRAASSRTTRSDRQQGSVAQEVTDSSRMQSKSHKKGTRAAQLSQASRRSESSIVDDRSSDETESLSANTRQVRRMQKQRHNRADSIESAELHEAAARSLKDHKRLSHPETASDNSRRPNIWDDANLRAAAEALARERGEDEMSVEFNNRKAALARSENRLRDIHVNEDHEYAKEVAAAAIAEEEDRVYAQCVYCEQRNAAARLRIEELNARSRLAREQADASRLKLEARQRRQLSASSDQNSQSTPITPTRSETPRASESPVSRSNAVTNIGEVTPPRSERSTHEFYDRVVLQRYRSAALANDGECSIPDQEIAWDKHGKPYECAPAPSRGSSIGTRGGKKQSGRTKDARDHRDRGPETSAETLGNPTAESTPIEQRSRSESHRQGTRSNTNDQTPTSRTIKQHRSSSGFYAKGGTPPAVKHDGGSPSGSSSSSESSESSSESSDSSKLEEEDESSSLAEESDSDSDYETDGSFGNSESTDTNYRGCFVKIIRIEPLV
ncbi:hypothetical protein B0H17DRAFT_1130406 [Mycena rosella]|uniref:Uncharacterized protein n=1 Tax=Mycena rosella TaxID=1033263 RepID=A0AAD7DQM3_MYCRO|nr:hypothetical protein B0H17DRAFT_1130406 [Mycena rosella]